MNTLPPEKINQIKQIIHERYNEVSHGTILYFFEIFLIIKIFFTDRHTIANTRYHRSKTK